MKKNIKDEIVKILPINIKRLFEKLPLNYSLLNEIRIRVNKPVICIYDNCEVLLDSNRHAYIATVNDMKELMQYVSNYSLYAYENEIKQGFITLKGGHRIGCCGKVVNYENEIKNIHNISYVNIRIAREIKGCSEIFIDKIYNVEKTNIYNTLIVSPPCMGKTTYLRDMVRSISDGDYGKGLNVGVVDERSEIAACYKGVAQNDIGTRTDVLDGCNKSCGMNMLLRAMSPSVIAVDEIGHERDLEAIKNCLNSGCRLLATVHGEDIEDIKNRNTVLESIMRDGIFERFVVIRKNIEGKRYVKVYDRGGRSID